MAKTPSVEECFARIEAAIKELEAGDMPLEDSLKRYEEGLVSVRLARKQLDAFVARLEELRAEEAPAPPKPEPAGQ